jgi:hypothetical protein
MHFCVNAAKATLKNKMKIKPALCAPRTALTVKFNKIIAHNAWHQKNTLPQIAFAHTSAKNALEITLQHAPPARETELFLRTAPAL